MVSAIVAEATAYGVNIKGPDGRTIKVGRAALADKSAQRTHGINLDDADEEVERLGYVAGTWRWQEGYYKAVVVPADHPRFRKATPETASAEQNMRAFGNPEGRRFTSKELAARSRQVKLTGKVTGWEKLL